MSYFPAAMEHVFKWEGGYVDHPSDPGGATNHGVSLRWYRQAVDRNATKDDIRRLTKAQASEIFRTHIWRHSFEHFSTQEVATKFFDMVVNMGVLQATRNLQRALHACGKREIKVDGLLGPKTLAACNSVRPDVCLAATRATKAAHYKLLVTKRSEFAPFLDGWLNRAYD